MLSCRLNNHNSAFLVRDTHTNLQFDEQVIRVSKVYFCLICMAQDCRTSSYVPNQDLHNWKIVPTITKKMRGISKAAWGLSNGAANDVPAAPFLVSLYDGDISKQFIVSSLLYDEWWSLLYDDDATASKSIIVLSPLYSEVKSWWKDDRAFGAVVKYVAKYILVGYGGNMQCNIQTNKVICNCGQTNEVLCNCGSMWKQWSNNKPRNWWMRLDPLLDRSPFECTNEVLWNCESECKQ